jgi:hypothetical protein
MEGTPVAPRTVASAVITKSGENIEELLTYADIPFKFGIDENGNYGYIKAGADTVTPFNNNFYVTSSVLDKGTFKGTTAKLANQYNGSVGFSGTGTVSSVTSTSYIGWQYELDLTNYTYLVFCHQKITNHGQATVKIDDTTVFANHYSNINTNQYLYVTDISGYTGTHKVTFHCGYVDSSGSSSSKSCFSYICFLGESRMIDWNM